MSKCRRMRGTTHKAGRVSLDLMPYFASVEYRERMVLDLLGGVGRSVSAGLTASSKTWNASSSLRCSVVGTCTVLAADQTDLCRPQIISIAC